MLGEIVSFYHSYINNNYTISKYRIHTMLNSLWTRIVFLNVGSIPGQGEIINSTH